RADGGRRHGVELPQRRSGTADLVEVQDDSEIPRGAGAFWHLDEIVGKEHRVRPPGLLARSAGARRVRELQVVALARAAAEDVAVARLGVEAEGGRSVARHVAYDGRAARDQRLLGETTTREIAGEAARPEDRTGIGR